MSDGLPQPDPAEPAPNVLCIGSVLWDVIGRTPAAMRPGADVPGRIRRVPGGVALNVAVTLRRFGLLPALLGAVGQDAEGDELLAACAAMGLVTAHLYRPEELPTDRYMAIEGAGGLVAAIADAHSLEACGARILRPLLQGPLGTPEAPWAGPVVLDGNLTVALLAECAALPALARADLRVAPASPGKAERLLPFLAHPSATLYLNREEAGLLTKTAPRDSAEAAEALLARGAARVVVTDGAQAATEAAADRMISASPPPVLVTRVTGAGDAFMAAHLAAELRGEPPAEALRTALRSAAEHVAGEPLP